ncbi:hypothetical protein D1007_38493 [Hordeum vulgare]|nr:hypothetical protein D1007_38493 [Hordeum vulgare]
MRIQAFLSKHTQQEERYAANNLPLWTTYFKRRHTDQLASINGFSAPRGRDNCDDHHHWWGVVGRMLHTVIEHIGGGSEPSLEYPTPSLSHRSGTSWLPRQMAGSSYLPSPRSSGTTPSVATVKADPQETSEHGRSCGGNLVINEGR